MKKQWLVFLAVGLLVVGAASGMGLALSQERVLEPVPGLICILEEENRGIRIQLDSNPSTGYLWSYQATPEGMLREVSQEYIPDEVPEGFVGAGGIQAYVFAPEEGARGTVSLLFVEARPWEEKGILSYQIDVTLLEDGTLGLYGISQPPPGLGQSVEEPVPPPR